MLGGEISNEVDILQRVAKECTLPPSDLYDVCVDNMAAPVEAVKHSVTVGRDTMSRLMFADYFGSYRRVNTTKGKNRSTLATMSELKSNQRVGFFSCSFGISETLEKLYKHVERVLRYMSMYEIHFFSGILYLSPAADLFSCTLSFRSRRGPACTPWHKCGSRPASVTRALGPESREIWQVTTGSRSDLLEPSRSMETPNCRFIFYHVFAQNSCWAVVPKVPYTAHSSLQILGSHGTTAELQAPAFVTATNVDSACERVNVRRACVYSVYVVLGSLQHTSSAVSEGTFPSPWQPSPARQRHGTTAALQAFPFVTATNERGLCMRECARVCMCISSMGPYIKQESGTQQFISAGEVRFQLFFSRSFLLPPCAKIYGRFMPEYEYIMVHIFSPTVVYRICCLPLCCVPVCHVTPYAFDIVAAVCFKLSLRDIHERCLCVFMRELVYSTGHLRACSGVSP